MASKASKKAAKAQAKQGLQSLKPYSYFVRATADGLNPFEYPLASMDAVNSYAGVQDGLKPVLDKLASLKIVKANLTLKCKETSMESQFVLTANQKTLAERFWKALSNVQFNDAFDRSQTSKCKYFLILQNAKALNLRSGDEAFTTVDQFDVNAIDKKVKSVNRTLSQASEAKLKKTGLWKLEDALKTSLSLPPQTQKQMATKVAKKVAAKVSSKKVTPPVVIPVQATTVSN